MLNNNNSSSSNNNSNNSNNSSSNNSNYSNNLQGLYGLTRVVPVAGRGAVLHIVVGVVEA